MLRASKTIVWLAWALAAGSALAEPKTVEVSIEHFAFAPATVAVSPGDTIVFVNKDITPHTATAVDSSWDTGEIAGGAMARLTVPPNAGADYFCSFHPVMKAKLTLTPGQ
jgi:plastocyanin